MLINDTRQSNKLHPSAHQFCEEAISENNLWFTWVHLQNQKSLQQKNSQQTRFPKVEVSFANGLFELFRVREQISKSRAENLSNGLISSYNHRFGTFLFNSYILIDLLGSRKLSWINAQN